MKRVFVIGGGKTSQKVVDCLLNLPSVSVIGMATHHPTDSAVKTVRKASIPVWFGDPLEILKKLDVDIVFNLTGDSKLTTSLATLAETRGFEVVTSDIALFFLDTFIEPDESTLFKKHLKISLMIAQSRTLEQVFDAIITGGLEMTHMPVGSLAMFNKEERTFTLLAQKGLPEALRPSDPYPIRLGGLTQQILAGGKPLVLSDIKKNVPFDTSALLKAGIRSLIAIPLLSERDLLGILYFDDIRPRSHPAVLVNVLCQFATEAVIAIQKHQAITQVRYLSTRDPLTDLYNRNQLALQLREATLSAEQNNTALGLLLCDLDRFKEMNETRGHHYGDKVLKLTSQQIKKVLASPLEQTGPPLLYRSGSDEIAVVLPKTTPEDALRKATLIREAIKEAGPKMNFPLDISIGIALYPQHSQSSSQMIVVADQSLQIAKKEENRICMGGMEPRYDTHQIGMIFEPIVHFDPNRIIGYEALGRDLQQEISIQELFKKYEDRGRLHELKNACFLAQLKKASELGMSQIFLNVDSVILNQCEWVAKPPDVSVVLEISESEPLHNVDEYLALAKRWKKKGFLFAIDDFGAGFISLPFLSQLNPDYIKIDRSVVLQAVSSRSFRRFFKRLVAAIQDVRTPRIIAEGIETEEELKTVRDVNIHFVQGFLLKEMGYVGELTRELHKV